MTLETPSLLKLWSNRRKKSNFLKLHQVIQNRKWPMHLNGSIWRQKRLMWHLTRWIKRIGQSSSRWSKAPWPRSTTFKLQGLGLHSTQRLRKSLTISTMSNSRSETWALQSQHSKNLKTSMNSQPSCCSSDRSSKWTGTKLSSCTTTNTTELACWSEWEPTRCFRSSNTTYCRLRFSRLIWSWYSKLSWSCRCHTSIAEAPTAAHHTRTSTKLGPTELGAATKLSSSKLCATTSEVHHPGTKLTSTTATSIKVCANRLRTWTRVGGLFGCNLLLFKSSHLLLLRKCDLLSN